MRRFLFRFTIFVAVNFVPVAVLMAMMVVHGYAPGYAAADSVITTIPEHAVYDLVILGTSHGKQFSKGSNRTAVENILHMNILNLGKDSAGILPAEAYLSYFFGRGNQTKEVVYFLDPFVFNAANWDGPFNDESFSMANLLDLRADKKSVKSALVKARADINVVYDYVASNIVPRPRSADEIPKGTNDKPILSINRADMEKSVLDYYPDGTSTTLFAKYASHLRNIVKMAEFHHTCIIFILPPNLGRYDPGKAMVVSLLYQYQQTYHVKFYDLSSSLKDVKYFGGYGGTYDHLSQAGVQYFTEHFLKPTLTCS